MSPSHQSSRAGTRWTVRIIPLFVTGTLALGTYAVVACLCIDYLYKQKAQAGVATAFLTLYALFFLLMFSAYLRTYYTVQRNPALVPLPSEVAADREANDETRRRRRKRDRDVEAAPWADPGPNYGPDPNPDSPGLEAFYSKDVFVCEIDGRPKWCSECRNWKPDRSNHSSDLGRCVRKMDHFCPWVGGVVSETSFNFFVQFTFYCTLFSAVCLAVGAYSLQRRHQDREPLDAWSVAVTVTSCLFGSFACGMTVASFRFILTNTTNIDMLRKYQAVTLAVRIPRTTPPSDKYPVIVYPLLPPRPPPPPGSQNQQPDAGNPRLTRDQKAQHMFAILRTGPRENPWNLGWLKNWKSVMGNSFVEWIIPIQHSPCCNHDSMESDYEYGPLVSELRERYGVPDINASCNGSAIEMHDRGTARA